MDVDELFSVFDEVKEPKNKYDADDILKQDNSDQNNDKDALEFIKSVLKSKRPSDFPNDNPRKKPRISDMLEGINPDDFISKMEVQTIDSEGDCLHEVVLPSGLEFGPLKPRSDVPAKEYQFTLDPFQNEALRCLDNYQSVLVSAHTSAGKTVVAEYAIAKSLQDNQRVVYTTPIKALSNQKYREFLEEFKDVGLITGDVTINPSASCLIMTVEILRNMLYRGSELMREIGWVIFDEVHYMRDKSRGVVWEETIILLPDFVHYVFLSATIPNARQFAQWICHLHKQPCHVVYTEYRPVPLKQYVFPAGGDDLHVIVDVQGNFMQKNFDSVMTDLYLDPGHGDKRGKKGGFRDDSDCYKIVKMIMDRNFAPVIVFSFSKTECEAYAMSMTRLDFNSDEEKRLVEEIFNNAMDVLSDADKNLSQVRKILPVLRRGIGIHHSGLLPIVKETIEILFSEGLIKALFATETFAVGLNMPARTVLFTKARKFDGCNYRWITSGEYIQMSGRAGRRGIDERGTAILVVDDEMTPSIGSKIVKGLPDSINSSFHLTYNMVLNLLRVEEISPEYMLKRSFFQFQKFSDVPSLCERLKKLCGDFCTFEIPNEEDVATYYRICEELKALELEAHAYIIKPEYCISFLQPGRMVKVVNGEDDFGWGMVVKCQKKSKHGGKNAKANVACTIDVLLHVSAESAKTRFTSCLKPPPPGEKGEMQIVPIKPELIWQFSQICLCYPDNLQNRDNRMYVLKTLGEVQARHPDGIPLLDPIAGMNIKDKGLHDIVKKIESVKARMEVHPQHNDPDYVSNCELYCRKNKIAEEIRSVKDELKEAKSLLHMDELKCRKRVLRRMGFCSESDVIEIKGRVACEISSADELVLTEMIFNGVFNDLDIYQILALLSCFVCEEKSNGEVSKLAEELSGPLSILQETARRIAELSKEAKLDIDVDKYVDSFKPYLMDVVHSWSKGVTFEQICKMTDIFEGSIIRSMRRLEELLRQMCEAASVIGNSEMENKFSEGIKLIKRDIIFAASLYL